MNDALLDKILHVSRRDRSRVSLLFVFGFGTAAAYVLARTITDSAFLSHFGSDRLPEVFLYSAGVVVVSSLVYAALLRVVPLRLLVPWTLLALAASSAAMPFAMHRFPGSLPIFEIAYLIAQVRGSLGTIQMSTLVNEHFGKHEPERYVGLIGAGATLAGIGMGAAIGLVAESVNVESLMYATAVIDVLTIWPVLRLNRLSRRTLAHGDLSPSQPPIAEDAERHSAHHEAAFAPSDPTGATPPVDNMRLWDALKSKYVVAIAGLVAVAVMAVTLVEYQWKATAAEQLQGDEEDLAKYFGYFYATVYFATGVLQLFITTRVLEKRGVLAGMLAFPGALLAMTCISWAVSVTVLPLWSITLGKGCDILRRALYDPSIQVLYSPLEKRMRRQAITLVAGIAKPMAEAIAGILLLAILPWTTTRQLSLVIIVLLAVGIIVVLRLWAWFQELRKAVDPQESAS